MISTEEIKKRKSTLENALFEVEVALNHDEYTKPFEFKRNDTIKEKDIKHPVLKGIMKKCIDNGSGFDPNLIVQHLEHEALEQFNEIVKIKIKGLSVKTLMELRHEMELLMLNDRQAHYKNELIKIEKMLIESVTKVEIQDLDYEKKVVKIDKRRKGNK